MQIPTDGLYGRAVLVTDKLAGNLATALISMLMLALAISLGVWDDQSPVATVVSMFLGAYVVVVTIAFVRGIPIYLASRRWGAHFEKHQTGLVALSLPDARAYQQYAQRMLHAPDTIRRRRPNGDVAAFDPLTGGFAVFDPDDQLRTFFAPWQPVLAIPHDERTRKAESDDDWLPLNPTEIEAIQAYLTAPLAHPRRPLPASVDALLDEWKKVLNEVWHGYPYGEDDYTNDLVLRDMIDDVAALLDEASRARLVEKIDAWDADFKRVTIERPPDRPMRYMFGTVDDIAKPGRWWWWRAPLVVDPTQGWDIPLEQ